MRNLVLLSLFCVAFAPLLAEQTPNQAAVSIIHKNLLDDTKMQEILTILAGKAISGSNKDITPEDLLKKFKTEIEQPQNMIKLTSIYEKRFNSKELTELQRILDAKVYEKYTEESYAIGKESLETAEAILKGIVSKEKQAKERQPSPIIEISSVNMKKVLEDTSKPIILDFYADWCAPCNAMQVSLDALSEEYRGKITFARVNIDNEEEIAASFKVTELPVIVFIKEGKIKGSLKNFATQTIIKDKIQKLLLP